MSAFWLVDITETIRTYKCVPSSHRHANSCFQGVVSVNRPEIGDGGI